jgi:hypothetical protein
VFVTSRSPEIDYEALYTFRKLLLVTSSEEFSDDMMKIGIETNVAAKYEKVSCGWRIMTGSSKRFLINLKSTGGQSVISKCKSENQEIHYADELDKIGRGSARVMRIRRLLQMTPI